MKPTAQFYHFEYYNPSSSYPYIKTFLKEKDFPYTWESGTHFYEGDLENYSGNLNVVVDSEGFLGHLRLMRDIPQGQFELSEIFGFPRGKGRITETLVYWDMEKMLRDIDFFRYRFSASLYELRGSLFADYSSSASLLAALNRLHLWHKFFSGVNASNNLDPSWKNINRIFSRPNMKGLVKRLMNERGEDDNSLLANVACDILNKT